MIVLDSSVDKESCIFEEAGLWHSCVFPACAEHGFVRTDPDMRPANPLYLGNAEYLPCPRVSGMPLDSWG